MGGNPDWTSVTQALTGVAGLVLVAIGFAFLYYQIRQVQRALHGETHSALYAQDLDLLIAFLSFPRARPYFYEGKELPADDPEYAQITFLAEGVAAQFEHIILQFDNLPEHIRPRWAEYMRRLYDGSPLLRSHLTEWGGAYSDRLHQLLGSGRPSGQGVASSASASNERG